MKNLQIIHFAATLFCITYDYNKTLNLESKHKPSPHKPLPGHDIAH